MKQNSPEWLAWRRQGLGASDAPVVMGVSPYTTRRELWELKLGLREETGESYVTSLGHKFEPQARARFSLESGLDLESDVCLTHAEFPHLRASLDGHCYDTRTFAEIKMVGSANMHWLKENKRPLDIHHPQIQHQFLVSGYTRGFYIAYCLDEAKEQIADYVSFPVTPEREYMNALFKELDEFWKLVETQTPPELSERDEYVFKGECIDKMVSDYLALRLSRDLLDEEIARAEDQIKSMANRHSRIRLGPVTVMKGVRKGNVDYKKVPELRGVNLEQYRSAPITVTTIRVDK